MSRNKKTEKVDEVVEIKEPEAEEKIDEAVKTEETDAPVEEETTETPEEKEPEAEEKIDPLVAMILKMQRDSKKKKQESKENVKKAVVKFQVEGK